MDEAEGWETRNVHRVQITGSLVWHVMEFDFILRTMGSHLKAKAKQIREWRSGM